MDHGPATQESAKPPTAPVLAIETAATHRRGRTTKLRVPASWPLLAILAVQAALSLRLVRADTAFEDEATYLWAGHLEWAHVLHGTPLPQFPSYFSGAPVLYPPIGALHPAPNADLHLSSDARVARSIQALQGGPWGVRLAFFGRRC